MNIHLVSDEKFINESFQTFEEYYPEENIFFVRVPRGFDGDLTHVEPNQRVIPVCFSEIDAVDQIIDHCEMQSANLFVHYLEPLKAHLAFELKQRLELKIYWIVYGADLYNLIYKHNEDDLYDYPIPNNSSLITDFFDYLKSLSLKLLLRTTDLSHLSEKFISKADYFCFWNYYDYKLLQNNYSSSNITFKYFRYFDSPVDIALNTSLDKKEGNILVNHSASKFGNHLTVLKKINRIDHGQDLNKVITPLSYGTKEVRSITLDYGKRHLGYCFKPIIEFLPKEEYFQSLNNISAALFGHRRQQGGATIHYLLAAGVKVFLRKENNLLKHYRDKGYVIYEIEEDLNTLADLKQLDNDVQKKNREIIRNEFSKREMDKCYKNLIQ